MKKGMIIYLHQIMIEMDTSFPTHESRWDNDRERWHPKFFALAAAYLYMKDMLETLGFSEIQFDPLLPLDEWVVQTASPNHGE